MASLRSGKRVKRRRRGDLRLDTSQRGAEAMMDAVPESDVLVRPPVEIQSLGILEDDWIAPDATIRG
jgi:hypothetical protein